MTLAEDLSWIPSASTVAHNHLKSSPRRSKASFWPLRASGAYVVFIHTCNLKNAISKEWKYKWVKNNFPISDRNVPGIKGGEEKVVFWIYSCYQITKRHFLLKKGMKMEIETTDIHGRLWKTLHWRFSAVPGISSFRLWGYNIFLYDLILIRVIASHLRLPRHLTRHW